MAGSGIDVVISMYRMLDVPALNTLLGNLNGNIPGQKHLYQHNWPQNSDKTEVCISIPTTDAYESELKFIDIDIRTPNLSTDGKPEFYPFPGENRPQDNTFPDLAILKQVTDVVLPLIVTSGDFYVETRIPGVPKRDRDGRWIVNIRVQFTLLDTKDTHLARLEELLGQPDGSGGWKPTRTTVWTGQAQRDTISVNPQLDKTAGIYGLYMRCNWLIPREAQPEKHMHLVTPEGEYVITGIIPEGIFWKLTTTRKDGDY